MTRLDWYPAALDLLVRHVVEPAVGAPYLSTANRLREFWAWPDERRRAWQAARLDAVLRHAAAKVPFYRSRLGAVDALSSEDLPVVDKATIRERQEEFRADDWRDLPHQVKRTGGTTGDPWRYELDLAAWTQMYAANIHFDGWSGYRYGERVAVLGTPPSLLPTQDGLKGKVRRALERRVFPSRGVGTDRASGRRHAVAASKSGAVLWYGYASIVAGMAGAVLAEGLSLPAPRAIVTTGEPLLPAWRRQTEQAFGVPVLDRYGCNDGGVLAQACERGRFHVAEHVSLVEVLDGDRPCPPGVVGDLVVTNLHARVLPFLRYRVGDRASLGRGVCPCGRPGTTLETIEGRAGDRLRLPDGTEIAMPALTTTFWEAPSVRRWQIVQREPGRVRVRLDVSSDFDEAEAALLRDTISEMCKGQAEVELTSDEPIEQTRGGKHRVVLSEL